MNIFGIIKSDEVNYWQRSVIRDHMPILNVGTLVKDNIKCDKFRDNQSLAMKTHTRRNIEKKRNQGCGTCGTLLISVT